MREDYEKLFSHLKSSEPPAGLLEKIMQRIEEEKRLLTLERRLMIFFLGTAVSALAFVPAFRIVQRELLESGFLQFLSLLFSDFGIITNYWQSFAMSLLETIPAVSLAMLSAAVFVFLGSLKFLARDLKVVFASKQLTNI